MAKMYRSLARRIVLAVIGLGVSVQICMIGFEYPVVIENEPLRRPRKVTAVAGCRMFLEGGEIIEVEEDDEEELRDQLSQSKYLVDIEAEPGGPALVYANQDGWICGTPFVAYFRIPLIPVRVYRNRREIIAVGRIEAAPSRPNAELQRPGPLPVVAPTP